MFEKQETQPSDVSDAQVQLECDGYTVTVPEMAKHRLIVQFGAVRDRPETHIETIIFIARKHGMLCHGVENGKVFLEYVPERFE